MPSPSIKSKPEPCPYPKPRQHHPIQLRLAGLPGRQVQLIYPLPRPSVKIIPRQHHGHMPSRSILHPQFPIQFIPIGPMTKTDREAKSPDEIPVGIGPVVYLVVSPPEQESPTLVAIQSPRHPASS